MLPRIQRTEWEVVGSTELVGTELAAAPEFGECGVGAVVLVILATKWTAEATGGRRRRFAALRPPPSPLTLPTAPR